ncbi:putative Serine/threonine-protein phosphatase 4 regulatory subunit 2 [Hypsibius exemplaris]|uniref:Serine/threonine-protein phosphatase 4 regulatory subunit 2 n=1 Tax=Hypsibius exemplaris TaxID=2072580 RepID=A0A9X6NI71_HYPEX|nr:putative Serine/threonine-protein phosphatase 4 regulatory subunit 2 [Hypsibius exemplaris]
MAETAAQTVEQFAPLKKMIAANGDLFAAGEESGDTNFTGLVDTFLEFIEKNGIPEGFTWGDVKAVFVAKFDEVTKKYEAERPIASLPVVPNVDNYTFDEYRVRILENLNRFEDSPFTLGRICELLREPRKHYDQGDKFLRAFEKCVTVTTTNGNADKATNGNHTNGHTESGTNGHITTNGDAAMETDASVEQINGVADTTTTAATTESNGQSVVEPVVVPEVATTTTEDAPMVNAAAEVPAETVDAVTSNGGADAVDVAAAEEEKTSQKRPNEEEDLAGKKVARVENGDIVGSHEVTHAVVGEPEVEPHQEESKKSLEADSAAVTELETVPVVEQETAAV